ncbi:RNA-binding S4 domain-containing protein [Wenzhouxiangella sp. EGI_FJ10409]|uniref:RNA-binding S4 domain-containing protein n=1 Tax=Wenzhouxiangella sp. EGI_FJ10409 TaxID=3243767 RepID=UPI0035DD90F9
MTDAVRLDKWLWATRFFKTRGQAQQAIKGGKVEINGASPKASRLVRCGDRLQVTKGETRFEIVVEEIGEKRVSAALAQQMYSETEAGRKARERQAEENRLKRAAGAAPDRRPDKRERRQLRRINRGD